MDAFYNFYDNRRENPMKCKAAISYEYNKPLVIEEVELDPPRENEVMIKLAATGICHSDVHCIHGEHGIHPLPAVGGHEICGYVEKVGKNVTYVKPGDLVVACLMPVGCGHCYYCTIGAPGLCEVNHIALFLPGRYVNKAGVRMTQFGGYIAGFAEYTTVPEINVIKIPSDFPVDKAALIACGVISGFGAVLYRAKVQPNKSVAVVGTGGVGLNAIQGAAFCGAYPIIAVDINDKKLEMARVFGATHTVNSKKVEDPIKEVRKITYGRGADYVLEAVAGIDILRQAFMMSAATGTTVVIGHGTGEKLSAWTPTDFSGGRILTGSAMGAIHSRLDIPRIIELYLAKKLKLDELVNGHYPFAKINDAIAEMEKGDVIRNVLMF
jgi:S-(hydroxymethyl)glutathione dehydrogenase/alcohol dehydrogenase